MSKRGVTQRHDESEYLKGGGRKGYVPRRGPLEGEPDFDPARDIELLPGKLMVRRDKREEVTPGGIVIPDTHEEVRHTGIVVSKAGLGTLGLDPEIGVGDRLLFSKYGGIDIDVGGERYTILEGSDIVARIADHVDSDRVD